MPRIAEKLEFMKRWAFNVRTKAGIRRKVRHKKRIFMQIFKKCLNIGNFLTAQGEFGKIIDIIRRNYVF